MHREIPSMPRQRKSRTRNVTGQDSLLDDLYDKVSGGATGVELPARSARELQRATARNWAIQPRRTACHLCWTVAPAGLLEAAWFTSRSRAALARLRRRFHSPFVLIHIGASTAFVCHVDELTRSRL